MELYTAGTGNGQRAAIAVNECGVPCKIHVLNLGQGDQKAADYLKINPTARIPTLIDPEGPGDQSEHLLSRRADAGKGTGFGDQVLRGPLRQSVALC